MRIALRGSGLRMAKQLANDWKPQTGTRSDRRMRMAKVMDANTIEPCTVGNCLPWLL
jgi:hypothetical protein